MIRMVVGVVVLLVAAYVLLNLGKQQAQALKPPARGASASAPVSADNLPQKYQRDVQKALQQGMERSASEPAP